MKRILNWKTTLAIPLFVGLSLPAQTAKPDAAETTEDVPVELSPFQVVTTQDKGYRATNSTSGTRLNAALKEIPMPIEVITAEFIRDIGAKDLRQALSYSSGIVLESQYDMGRDLTDITDAAEGITGGKEQTQIKLRGFATTETLRRGFRRASYSDSIAIDRIEVVRGPAALLYGIGNFGGIVNYLPKEPLQTPHHEFGVSIGSWDSYRGELDVTGPMGDQLDAAYRLVASADTKNDHTDFRSRESLFVMPSFSFKPTKTTRVLIDMEMGTFTQTGIGFQSVRANANGFAYAGRQQVPFLPTPGKDPRTFRWSGPDTFRDEENFNLMGEVTQQITPNLTVLVGAQTTRTEFDERNIRARLDDTPVPPAQFKRPFEIPEIGVFMRTIQVALGSAWYLSNEKVDTDQFRIEANYKFEIGKTEHNLLAGRTDLNRVRDRSVKGTNNLPTQQYNWRAPDDLSYFRYDPANQVPLNQQLDEDLHRDDTGHYFVYQGKFIDNRLNLIGGIRHDRTDGKRVFRNLTTGMESGVQGSKAGKPTTKTSPQYGASFAVTREITLFALASSGLSPNDDKTDGAGYVMRPTTAKSLEAGFKVDLFNGRVSGTLSAYQIDRKDVPQYIWWAPAPVRTGYDPTKPLAYRAYFDSRNRIYYVDNPADRAILQTVFDSMNNPNLTAPSDSYLYWGNDVNWPPSGAYCPVDDESKGIDAQLIFTLKPNWQVVLGYAHVQRRLVQGPELVASPYSPFSPWLARSDSPVGIWGGGTLSNFRDPTDSTTYNRSFGVGLRLDDSPADSFTLWNHYRFENGPLTGFAVGAGVRYEGPRNFLGGENSITTDGTLVKPYGSQVARFGESPDRLQVDLGLSYRTKWRNEELTFQLNVANLMDNQDLYGALYNPPRSYRFSIGTRF